MAGTEEQGTAAGPQVEDWHALEAQQVFDRLESSPGGLTRAEAEARLARYGPNHLPETPRKGALARLLAQFNNVIIYVLLVAGAVTAALEHWVDSWVIFGVVVVNALIGFIQEGKAERALDAVRNMLSLHASAVRDGVRGPLPAEDLVPGDVVHLQSGDRVPADLRLFRVKELHIDEAMLTGESVPVGKSPEPVAPEAVLGDRRAMAYSGTLVTSGQGAGVVVGTGAQTELGRISTLLGEVRQLTTPLLRQLDRFGRWLTIAILAVATAAFLFGTLVRGYGADDMFLAAVGLAVAAIPEGLPAIITIALAVGVQAMAARRAIIRRLPAVETLGSVTVICSDKTGTLTRNEMTVQSVATAEHRWTVGGVGYDSHGAFNAEGGGEVVPGDCAELMEMCRSAVLCNDASAHAGQRDGWSFQGDPTETALLVLGVKAGLNPLRLAEEYPRDDIIPFESRHRFMATLHHDHGGHRFVYLKGAPEAVMERCGRQRVAGEDRPLDPRFWHELLEEIGARGQRTLAFAVGALSDDQRSLEFSDVEGGLTLLGVTGMMDPPRREAVEAVRRCRSAGISVKMITGDHAVTARAIAAAMGIGGDEPAMTGVDLEQTPDEPLRERAVRTDVFARVSPEHKLRLVKALQAGGEVVAMTGDGVNDAPALKRADVGVAMGIKGTEAAKEASEMVLVDDNFASITHAVEEGRRVYDNIKKSILFILPTNGGEAFTILAAIALGRMLPVTAVQILWVNMITAVTLALSLVFEPAEPGVMRRPPRETDAPLLSGFMIWRILFVSLIMVVGTFGLFIWERSQGTDIAAARTVAVNMLVVFEAYYLLSTRYLLEPVLNARGLLGNPKVPLSIALVMLFQLLFTYAPPMQLFFGSAPIDGAAWGRILVIGVSVLVLVELEKAVLRALRRRV